MKKERKLTVESFLTFKQWFLDENKIKDWYFLTGLFQVFFGVEIVLFGIFFKGSGIGDFFLFLLISLLVSLISTGFLFLFWPVVFLLGFSFNWASLDIFVFLWVINGLITPILPLIYHFKDYSSNYKREFFAEIDSLAPLLTYRWLERTTKGKTRKIIHNLEAIIESTRIFLEFLQKHNKFPSKGDLFKMGSTLDAVDPAIKLLETRYIVRPKDFNEIIWDEFDRKTKSIVKKLGDNSKNYSLESLVLDADVDLITAKLFLAVFPYLELEKWVEKLPELQDVDMAACSIIRLQYCKDWISVTLFQVAFGLELGLVTVAKGIHYVQQFVHKDYLNEPFIESDLEQMAKIEKTARKLLIAMDKGTIRSMNDAGEVAEKLNLKSFQLTIQTIKFANQELKHIPDELIHIPIIDTIGAWIEKKAVLSSDYRLLADLSDGKAIPLKTLQNAYDCKQTNLPRKLKKHIEDVINGYKLVFRASLILLSQSPPDDALCQLCGQKLTKKDYFQCSSCEKYLCTADYVNMIQVKGKLCPYCNGQMMSFPFSCDGCSLDFAEIIDVTKSSNSCPNCGHRLPLQSKLIGRRTSGVISSIPTKMVKEKYTDKKGV